MRISLATLVTLGGISALLASTRANPLPVDKKLCLEHDCNETSLVASLSHSNRKAGLSPAGNLLPRIFAPKAPPKEGTGTGRGTGTPSENFGEGNSGEFGGGNGPTSRPGEGTTITQPEKPIPLTDEEVVTKAGLSGKSAQQGLRDAISNRSPDTDPGTVESKGYIREETDDTPPLAKEVGCDKSEYLGTFGIKAKDMGTDKLAPRWTNHQISNQQGSTTPILTYAIGKEDKTIIIKEAYPVERDTNRRKGASDAEKANILKLKDINMDNWRVEMKDAESIKNLKWIVRDEIVTAESKTTINAAFEKVNVPKNTMATFGSKATDANELAAFEMLAGTPHGNGIIKMLSDHHNELGDLEVKAFHVFHRENPVPGYYALVAEIGRA